MNAIIAFAASPLSVLKKNATAGRLGSILLILGDNLLFTDTYGQ
jgi:hypothetical protein